jgi:hypothetical protein
MYWFNCKIEIQILNTIQYNYTQYFYEFYINGLKMTELDRNILPQ